MIKPICHFTLSLKDEYLHSRAFVQHGPEANIAHCVALVLLVSFVASWLVQVDKADESVVVSFLQLRNAQGFSRRDNLLQR